MYDNEVIVLRVVQYEACAVYINEVLVMLCSVASESALCWSMDVSQAGHRNDG